MRAGLALPLWIAMLCAGSAGCTHPSTQSRPDGASSSDGSSDGSIPAEPLRGPSGTWTWIDIPGMVCDDGTPTGVAYNPSPTGSTDLLIYFLGGGACWDYATCAVLNTSAHGPYGSAQFEAGKGGFSGSALDRSIAGSAWSGFNMVFVPYCTGDLHAGETDVNYTSGGQQRLIHHRGRTNLRAVLPRLVSTWPQPRKLVVTGSSAGGFGATLNYDVLRASFRAAQGYLVDDSGPSLSGEGTPTALRDVWYAQWGLLGSLGSICPDCQSDFSLIYPALMSRYPADRFSLLSYTQDKVIRAYLGNVSAAQFQASLYATATSRFDPAPQSRVFFVAGDSHVLVTTPLVASKGTSLLTFLAQQTSDDAGWVSVRP